jgi:hypothetical protein
MHYNILIWNNLIFTLILFSSSHPYKMNTEMTQSIIYQTFINDLGPLPETSMKVEKKSELIGRRGFYRRPVIRIRIQISWIHVFLGLLDPDPDPDPLARGMDPDPDPSNIKQK